MACLPVMYALCWLVMASSASEAKEEDTDTFTVVANRKINNQRPDPQYHSAKHVQEGRNITLVCSIGVKTTMSGVTWHRKNTANYVVFVSYHNNVCTGQIKNKTLIKLHVGSRSCTNNSYELEIRNIDKGYEGGWYCVVSQEFHSDYIDLKVEKRNGVTPSQVSHAPTTSMVKVSQQDTLASKSTKATTGYSTERTDKESGSINTLVPLIGGAAGGAFVLLALVITGCVLYRSKREVIKPNDGPASLDHDRDPGANVEEAVVMEGDVMYGSCGAGNDDYAQIPCREPASASHEKEDASVLKNQPDTEDRNTNQPGVDSGDIYAIPDKPKKSTVEDVEDVYSQVQKPKKGIE